MEQKYKKQLLEYERRLRRIESAFSEVSDKEWTETIVQQYENSTCWKITKPLRVIMDGLRSIKYKLVLKKKRHCLKGWNRKKHENTMAETVGNKDAVLIRMWVNPKFSGKVRIAVQAHIFFTEYTEEMIEYMNHIPEGFDCYVTTNTEEKANLIFEKMKDRSNAYKVEVWVSENRGRDVAPFIIQMSQHFMDYEYLCHIHSKKSTHFDNGNEWRQYLLYNLMGSSDYIREEIIAAFDEDQDLGIIYPDTYPRILSSFNWGNNMDIAKDLLSKMGLEPELNEIMEFPAGNMFWARIAAVRQMFQIGLDFNDFPEEVGQTDETIAHAIERSWYYIAWENGYYQRSVMMKQ